MNNSKKFSEIPKKRIKNQIKFAFINRICPCTKLTYCSYANESIIKKHLPSENTDRIQHLFEVS